MNIHPPMVNHVILLREYISTQQTKVPNIGMISPPGTLKRRGKSLWVRRKIITDIHTKKKADNAPIEHISLKIEIGIKADRIQIKTIKNMCDR